MMFWVTVGTGHYPIFSFGISYLNICNNIWQELSSDSSQHVRSALASVIMGMAPVLGKVRISDSVFALILAREV